MLFQDRALANSRRWAVAITTLLSFVLIVSATVTAATWPSADSGAGPAAIPAPATAADPCDAADCEEPSQPEIAAELPNLVFRTADGAEVSLGELRGSVVVVEFWASWCRYCEADVPVMKSLHGLMSDTRDFQLAGASISESAEAMWAYVDEHGIEWPQAQLEGGWKDDVTRAFGVRGVPSRYLIDRDGRATLLPRTDAEGMARLILKAIDGEPVVASTAR